MTPIAANDNVQELTLLEAAWILWRLQGLVASDVDQLVQRAEAG